MAAAAAVNGLLCCTYKLFLFIFLVLLDKLGAPSLIATNN